MTWVNLVADTSTGLGLGEPWDSLFKAAGATLLIVLLALWTNRLFLPNAIKDREERLAEKDKRIEELAAEIVAVRKECSEQVAAEEARTEQLRQEQRETTQWLQTEAIPLISRTTELIRTLSTQSTKSRAAR